MTTYTDRQKACIRDVLTSMECTAQWLENGCDPKEAAAEIRLAMSRLTVESTSPITGFSEPAGGADVLREELASTKRMFLEACADLGAINEAMGLDPEDGGAEPIIDAIEKLKGERDQWVDAQYAAASEPESACDPADICAGCRCKYNTYADAAPSTAAQGATLTRTHTTQAGEALGGIALRQCGSEDAWRAIIALNPDFSDWTPPDYFPVGTVLNLPSAAPTPVADSGAMPQILKGIGKINGDGWKDVTRKGENVFVWNAELPEPYKAGQYPRIGCENWSASTDQFDFQPASIDEIREFLAAAKPVSVDAVQGATLTDDARECLLDVVSHHDNIVAGFAAQRAAAQDANDSDTAAYWQREINVAHRMQEQAKRALAAPTPVADSGAITDERLTELAVDHLHIDYDRMPAGVVPLLRAAIGLATAPAVLTDEQIDSIWLYRANIHNGELIPQLRDFARALLATNPSDGASE